MITKPQGDSLFWEVYWQGTTKQCMHYQADIVFLNKRLIMPGHTGLLSAHSYKQTTPTDFRQLLGTWKRNSKFFLWGVLYLLLMLSGPSTFQNSLVQCTHSFDLWSWAVAPCTTMKGGTAWRALSSELLIDVVPGQTVLLFLLTLVFPFQQTSPIMVTQVSEAPLPSALPFSQMPLSHYLPSHLLSCPVNSD